MTTQKKEVPYTVRVEVEVSGIIERLAKEDERTISFVLRKLIMEALEARKLIKRKKPS